MNGTELAATDLVAGVDVSKARLDTQVEPGAATRSFPNDAAGQRTARDCGVTPIWWTDEVA